MANLQRISDLNPIQIASICDHTFLSTVEAYREKADKNNDNAVVMRTEDFYKFLEFVVKTDKTPYSVCVRPEDVKHAKKYLKDNCEKDIKVASVIGFPHGFWFDTKEKLDQTLRVSLYGADEIDPVINYQDLIHGKYSKVEDELQKITDLAHETNMLVKLILETTQLKNADIEIACKIAESLGVDFVKTSTTFAKGGAREEHLKIMKQNFSRGIKISGGVNENNLYSLIQAASGRDDGYIDLDPMKIRIGEGSLLSKLSSGY